MPLASDANSISPVRKSASPEGRKNLDIRTVAARAGVSIATVSRTINAVPSVSPELAERVWKAIEDLNYYPNTQARALVSGRSRIFGLIVEDITNPFFPELIQGFEELAVLNGYEILISSTGNVAGRLTTCIRRMLERKVEGVAVLTFGQEEPVLSDLVSRNVPLVLAEFRVDNPKISTILLDYQTGIQQAIDHLKQLGHRDVAFISGPLTLHSANTRREAFLQAMTNAGLTAESRLVLEGDHSLDGGVRAFASLQAGGLLPTAILCSNDTTAIGVLRAAYHAGLKVPEDLSVIGLDDIHFAEFTLPPLTTIRLSRSELAEAAFTALRSMVEPDVAGEPQHEFQVSTSLIVRGSTAAPRPA